MCVLGRGCFCGRVGFGFFTLVTPRVHNNTPEAESERAEVWMSGSLEHTHMSIEQHWQWRWRWYIACVRLVSSGGRRGESQCERGLEKIERENQTTATSTYNGLVEIGESNKNIMMSI